MKANAGAPTAREAEQEERRRRLIQAAFDLGAEGGYDSVQMRDVAAQANVAMATIYRYFSSKDHLLAAAMHEWTERLRARVAQAPPKGVTVADRLVDVFDRACRAMERQPKLSAALVRALSATDAGVRETTASVSGQIAAMADPILEDFAPRVRADILAVIGHVWYSTLTSWAHGHRDFSTVQGELERAIRVLVEPHQPRY